MTLWLGLGAIPADLGPTVVTLGVFDGVHRGHQLIVGEAVRRARSAGIAAVALTFHPHPLTVVRPAHAPSSLLSLSDRVLALEALGVAGVCVLEFNQALSELSPAAFVEQVLVDGLSVQGVVVGANFRFGHHAAGTTDTLHSLGQELGFWVEIVGLSGDGTSYSSTRIRELVGSGDVAGAAQVIGRPHRLVAPVIRGDQRGRELGYPTANLGPTLTAAIPADGVYAGHLVRADGSRWPAAISIGINPTFDGHERRVEAYVLDETKLDLYGETVAVEFVERLRTTERFASVEALIEQMAQDVDRTRQVLRVTPSAG